ncbi:MAG: DUF3488 and transglutaminase-like domain-containing protein [Acidimicrobiia bacterium]
MACTIAGHATLMVARARLVAPFTLAILSAAAALSLGRVFASDRFVIPVLIAVVLAHGAGALARWRAWPLWATALLSVAVLACFVVVTRGEHVHVFGVELGGSSRSLATQLEAGWNLLRTAPPPAPVTDGALLLAVIVTFVVAAVADWAAFRRDAVLGATAPALVLFVWATTLGADQNRVLTVLGFAAGAAAFLLAQNLAVLDKGRSWLVSQRTQSRHWLAPAVILATIAVVIGVVLAPALPGAGADPILDFAGQGDRGAGGSSYRTGIPPLVDVGAKLNDATNRELFTVSADHADYWRVAALDRFTADGGGQWTLQAEGDEVDVGLPTAGPAGSFHQEYDIGSMSERWLPAAYRPVAISLADTLVVRSSSTLVTSADSVEGLQYSVDSIVPVTAGDATPAAIAATAAPVPARLRPYTQLPANTPEVIGATANAVVTNAGATTPYAQAEALRNFFRTAGFVYDLSVDPVDTPDAVATFLRDQRGFCVQFATAYAVMARSLGIPTRIAVGFTPGTVRDGTYHVFTHDAHAWPEVWLAGMGWTHMFDPTPPAGTVANATSGGSALPRESAITPVQAVPATTPTTSPATTPTQAPGGTGNPATTTPTTSAANTTAPSATTVPGTPPATAATPEVTTASGDSNDGPWLAIALVIAIVVLAIVAVLGFIVWAKARRRARRRAAEPDDAVLGAWEEALDHLRDARITPDPALTPLEVGRAITPGAPDAIRPLHELARRYTAVRYGPLDATPDDAARAWEAVDSLGDALDASINWRERWRRRLDPSTLVRSSGTTSSGLSSSGRRNR